MRTLSMIVIATIAATPPTLAAETSPGARNLTLDAPLGGFHFAAGPEHDRPIATPDPAVRADGAAADLPAQGRQDSHVLSRGDTEPCSDRGACLHADRSCDRVWGDTENSFGPVRGGWEPAFSALDALPRIDPQKSWLEAFQHDPTDCANGWRLLQPGIEPPFGMAAGAPANRDPGSMADSEPDPVSDSGPDVGPDVGPDSGPDAGPDAGPDTGPNTGPTPGSEAGPDTGPNTDPDPAPDQGPGTGPSGGRGNNGLGNGGEESQGEDPGGMGDASNPGRGGGGRRGSQP